MYVVPLRAILACERRVVTNALPCFPPQSECPGPGSYHKPASLELNREVNTNVSKLGYGVGFVSKVCGPCVIAWRCGIIGIACGVVCADGSIQ